MFNAGLRAHSLAVLLLLFSVQWKRCVSTAEDFASDGSSVGDDYISYNQQSFSTENAPARANFNYLDNYDQQDADESEAGKVSENGALDDKIESVSNEGDTAQKSFKDIESGIIYGDTGEDIILKDSTDGQWKEVKKVSTLPFTSKALKTATTITNTRTTTAAPTTSIITEDADGFEDSAEGFHAVGSRPNDYNDWLTNRRRRVHSAFQKHKAHHRNYHSYDHKGQKNAFGRYKKYEHHRSKYKGVRLHHHQHHSHVHYPVFDEEPYYQGKVSYYGQDDDSVDSPGVERFEADKSLHLPAKMRSYQHYGQLRRDKGGDGGVSNSHRSDAYRNRGEKWPHLQRIEYQITKDERRERIVDDYEEQLPPYIRKYNRRNKQLLDLLEGTMPPSTTSTVAPQHVSAKVHYSGYGINGGSRKEASEKHDGRSHKGRRSHFHNHRNPKWIVEDLFEEQRANPNNPNVEDDQYLNDSVMPSKAPKSAEVNGNSNTGYKNSFNGKDFPDEDDDGNENVSKDNENENIILLQKNEFPTGSVFGSFQNRSQKAGERPGSMQPYSVYTSNDKAVSRSKVMNPADTPGPVVGVSPTEELKISPKANQFIYHRVASSRSVGTGTNIIGVDGGSRKQRLPFVAITDRRLETSKMQKQPADFRQNHLPLP